VQIKEIEEIVEESEPVDEESKAKKSRIKAGTEVKPKTRKKV